MSIYIKCDVCVTGRLFNLRKKREILTHFATWITCGHYTKWDRSNGQLLSDLLPLGTWSSQIMMKNGSCQQLGERNGKLSHGYRV